MKQKLEKLYSAYNRREYVHPDPLEFLYRYPDIKDREIAGLLASALAFGRVSQILQSVQSILDIMDNSPFAYLNQATEMTLSNDLKGFVYRFVKGRNVVSFFLGMKGIVDHYGSIGECFVSQVSQEDETLVPAMSRFVSEFSKYCSDTGYLIASPDKGSACKRMNLYLRWMVRNDSVDPGGWDSIPRSKLIIPLDTHMHSIGLKLGFTNRKQAGMRTAVDITNGFRSVCLEDPVKYDFALTRFGIRDDMEMDDLFQNHFMQGE